MHFVVWFEQLVVHLWIYTPGSKGLMLMRCSEVVNSFLWNDLKGSPQMWGEFGVNWLPAGSILFLIIISKCEQASWLHTKDIKYNAY